MTRHIVCLSYDFDVQSGFISRGLTSPTPLSRGEFGVAGRKGFWTCLLRTVFQVLGLCLASQLRPIQTLVKQL